MAGNAPGQVRGLDSKQSRLGLVECLNHGLLHPFPVLHEKVELAFISLHAPCCWLRDHTSAWVEGRVWLTSICLKGQRGLS